MHFMDNGHRWCEVDYSESASGRAWTIHASVVFQGILGALHRLFSGPVQPRLQQEKGHCAGHALSGFARAGSEARSLHAGLHFDVVLDLRPSSPSHGKWYGAELSADNGNMLYVPENCAHGYQTLRDDTEVFYMASEFYTPNCGPRRALR